VKFYGIVLNESSKSIWLITEQMDKCLSDIMLLFEDKYKLRAAVSIADAM
jgi:hypothetical protein